MNSEPKKRVQVSKDERRAQAEAATVFATQQSEAQAKARNEKTARLRDLRLARDAERANGLKAV